MTDKAQAKIEELEAQKVLIEKVDEILERVERDKKYALTNSELIYERDADGNMLEDENGKKMYHWEDHEYTEEELENNPTVRGEIRAYETIIKALEKLI